jgi:hypothetical protein
MHDMDMTDGSTNFNSILPLDALHLNGHTFIQGACSAACLKLRDMLVSAISNHDMPYRNDET